MNYPGKEPLTAGAARVRKARWGARSRENELPRHIPPTHTLLRLFLLCLEMKSSATKHITWCSQLWLRTRQAIKLSMHGHGPVIDRLCFYSSEWFTASLAYFSHFTKWEAMNILPSVLRSPFTFHMLSLGQMTQHSTSVSAGFFQITYMNYS